VALDAKFVSRLQILTWVALMATSSISVGSLSVVSSVVAVLLAESTLAGVACALTSLDGVAGDDSGATAGVAVDS